MKRLVLGVMILWSFSAFSMTTECKNAILDLKVEALKSVNAMKAIARLGNLNAQIEVNLLVQSYLLEEKVSSLNTLLEKRNVAHTKSISYQR